MSVPNTVPAIDLIDGSAIPQLGFGVFQIDPDVTAEAVLTAFDVGYRHIDTAQMYGNEAGVGDAVRNSGLDRDDVWITSKLNNNSHSPSEAERTFDETLSRLGLDRIDLFLIHWPLPTVGDGDYAATWKTLTGFVADGRARSVGVSNFQPDHLTRIVDATGVIPVVNQIEVHPYFGNETARAATLALGTKVEAWSPIAQGAVLTDPVVTEIAETRGRTPSQVTLRWHVQRGDIVFPKSTHRERMEENFGIFDFSLTEEEMARVSGLDKGEDGRTGPDPDTFDMVPE